MILDFAYGIKIITLEAIADCLGSVLSGSASGVMWSGFLNPKALLPDWLSRTNRNACHMSKPGVWTLEEMLPATAC